VDNSKQESGLAFSEFLKSWLTLHHSTLIKKFMPRSPVENVRWFGYPGLPTADNLDLKPACS